MQAMQTMATIRQLARGLIGRTHMKHSALNRRLLHHNTIGLLAIIWAGGFRNLRGQKMRRNWGNRDGQLVDHGTPRILDTIRAMAVSSGPMLTGRPTGGPAGCIGKNAPM